MVVPFGPSLIPARNRYGVFRSCVTCAGTTSNPFDAIREPSTCFRWIRGELEGLDLQMHRNMQLVPYVWWIDRLHAKQDQSKLTRNAVWM